MAIVFVGTLMCIFCYFAEDEQFEADKSVLIKEIATLQLKDHSNTDIDDCANPC